MIDSRDFLIAKKLAEAQLLCHRTAIAGGVDGNDHQRIWEALDKAHAKHPDMVALRAGSAKKTIGSRAARRIIPKLFMLRSIGKEP